MDALAILRRLEPYLDAIICYASTQGEHEPNRIAADVRAALAQQAATPAPAEPQFWCGKCGHLWTTPEHPGCNYLASPVAAAPATPAAPPAAQAGDALPPNFVSLYVARSALEAALNSTPERVSVPYAYDQPQSDNDVRMIFRRAARGAA